MKIVRSIDDCAALWRSPSPEWCLLQDWALRLKLAEAIGMQPYFMVSGGTVLPLGLFNDKLWFWGGPRYCERNGFIGERGNEREIMSALRDSSHQFRLLSWEVDPLPHVPHDCLRWDVPFNQYWEIDEYASENDWFCSLSEGECKSFNYLERKFAPTVIGHANIDTINDFIDHTIEARGGKSAHAANRVATMLTVMHLMEAGKARFLFCTYQSQVVGVGVFAVDEDRGEAVYLLNLYKKSPAKVSNCITMAIVKWCIMNGLRLDGMRGAFSLKPRVGYRPRPSYALVNDPEWKTQAKTDLPAADLILLYGRQVG